MLTAYSNKIDIPVIFSNILIKSLFTVELLEMSFIKFIIFSKIPKEKAKIIAPPIKTG